MLLLSYLQEGPDASLWSGNISLGGLFGGGRPDLLYNLAAGMYAGWEIKPTGQDDAANAQLQRYVNASDSRLIPGDNSLIFPAQQSTTLTGGWFDNNHYTYSPGRYDGTVTYSIHIELYFGYDWEAHRFSTS